MEITWDGERVFRKTTANRARTRLFANECERVLETPKGIW
jgi:hypothetical protein